jgi:glucan biosynthesis protein
MNFYKSVSRIMKTRWAHSILLCLLACRSVGAQFDFENVRVLAENLAGQPFKPPSSEIIEPLLNLNYEQYQAIQFNDKKSLWREDALPWRLVIEIVEPRQALNLRARLERRGHPITETWDYTWQP